MATVDQDILLNDYDLWIKNGDFVIGESEQQESDLIINTFQGNWFQYPLVGVGIVRYLAGTTPALQLENIIVQQLKADGFAVDSVSIVGTTLNNIKIQVLAHRN